MNPVKKLFGKPLHEVLGKKNIYLPVPHEIRQQYNSTRINGSQPVLCYAPFKNLYFGHEGKITSCCYNRKYLLGTYPRQSIKEIWFGKEAERLRQFIIHNDLSLGCQNCRYHLYSGNFDAVKTKTYDAHRENKNKYPSVFEMELINTCNLECVMCSGRFSSSIRKNRENLPPVEEVYDDYFLNQLEEFIPYLDEVKFYGGEPFLIDIYYRICDLIAKINPQCRITIQTNGTILNNRVREILKKCNFHFSVSMESLEKKNYESIRVNGKFESVIDNIMYFREYTRTKNTFFGISVCAIRQNWHEIPDFITFCNRLNAPIYINTVWHPPHCSLWNLDPGELEKIVSHLQRVSFPQSTAVEKKNERHFNDFVKQTESWLEHSKKRECDIINFDKSENEQFYMDMLCTRIRKYIRSLPRLSDAEKEQKEVLLIKKLDEVTGRIPVPNLRDKILQNTNSVSIEIIVSNLEANSVEKILNQAIAFGETLFFE